MTRERRAFLLVVAFAALWAGVEAIARHVVFRYSAFQVVWARYAVHLLLMLVIWGRSPASLWRTRRPAYQLGRSLLMLVMPGSWALAMAGGTPGNLILGLFWVSPVVILLLAAWILDERPGLLTWVAALAGYAGAVLTFRPPLPAGSQLVLPLLMSLSFSLYVVLTRPLRFETTRANLFYSALGVFLALTPLMPRVWQAPPLHDVGIFIVIGVLGYVALWCVDRFAALAPVSLTAPVLYLHLAFLTLESVGGVGRSALLGAVAVAIIAAVTWWRMGPSAPPMEQAA